MDKKLDMRRIVIFIALSFGLAWLMGLILYLNGGLTSPIAVPLLTFGYMMAPALAHVLTRVITREGWANTGLQPKFKRGWPFWALAWLLPALLVILGAAVYYLFFPQQYDGGLTQIQNILPAGTVSPWTFVILQIVQAVLLAPIINSLFTFGEEFGWRGYLQPKLMPLGGRKAMLLMGVIWGMWHWPLTIQGHNYGLEYSGYPWAGMLMMLVFTTALGTFLGWVTLRSGSVWPAVIGHAAINGMGALPALFTLGQPNMLLGPMVAGIIGGIGFIALALVLFIHPRALASTSTPAVEIPLPAEQEALA